MNELINRRPVASANKCINTGTLIQGKFRLYPQADHQKATQVNSWFYYRFPLPGLDFLVFTSKAQVKKESSKVVHPFCVINSKINSGLLWWCSG